MCGRRRPQPCEAAVRSRSSSAATATATASATRSATSTSTCRSRLRRRRDHMSIHPRDDGWRAGCGCPYAGRGRPHPQTLGSAISPPGPRRETSEWLAAPTAGERTTVRADKLARLNPVRIEYDEMRSAEERTTDHQPRLQALGEFFLDVHPLRRIGFVRRPSKRKAPPARWAPIRACITGIAAQRAAKRLSGRRTPVPPHAICATPATDTASPSAWWKVRLARPGLLPRRA